MEGCTTKWGRVFWLRDDTVEVGVALDFGLRIVHLSCMGKENLFYEQPQDLSDGGATPEGWKLYGGHRLWMAPESDDSYAPDNAPITYRQEPDGSILFQQAPDSKLNIRKSLRLRLLGNGGVEVENRIENLSQQVISGAAWGVNTLDAGGTAEIPFSIDPQNVYAPQRLVSLWGTTNLHDERIQFSKTSLKATHFPREDYFKIGLYCQDGYALFRNKNQQFRLEFPVPPMAQLPDNGCNFELYMNRYFLEMESLGVVSSLQPGQACSHTEIWRVSPL